MFSVKLSLSKLTFLVSKLFSFILLLAISSNLTTFSSKFSCLSKFSDMLLASSVTLESVNSDSVVSNSGISGTITSGSIVSGLGISGSVVLNSVVSTSFISFIS